jgi:hypothetical protein
LDTIITEALADLYSPSTVNISWARLQRSVSDLDTKLNQWRSDLNPGLLVPPNQKAAGLHPPSERMYLNLRFFGASMLINRPCLCDVHELNAAIPSQSEASRRIDMEAAIRCISAARGLLQLLPRDVNAVELYKSSPWWCVLHYLVQAGVILIMEISFDTPHIPAEIDTLITESAHVLRWLLALSTTSPTAQRAWVSLSRLLRLAIAKAGKDPGISALYISVNTSLPPLATPTAPIFRTQESSFLSGQVLEPWETPGSL